jgi:hypothetical protein
MAIALRNEPIAVSVTASENCRQVCAEVWRDRMSIIDGRGDLSAENALLRAVYWRLCKIGDDPGQGLSDAPSLKELIGQYRDEAAQSVEA